MTGRAVLEQVRVAAGRVDVRDLLGVAGMPVLLAAVLVLVVVPSDSLLPTGPFDEQRTFQAWVLALACGCVVLDARVRDRVRHLVVDRPVLTGATGALGLLGLLSAATSPDPIGGLLELGLFAGSLALALCVASVVHARPQAALALLVGGAVVALLYYVADLLTLPDLGQDWSGLWRRGRAGGFANVRFMNHFHAMLLPLAAVAAGTRATSWLVRGVAVCGAASAAWYLVVTEARGGLLALLLACAAVLVTRRAAAADWRGPLLLAAVLGGGLAVLTRVLRAAGSTAASGGGVAVVNTDGLVDTSFRQAMWGDALSVALDRPLTGLGPGGFAWWPNEGLLFGPFAHPHDSVLQVAAEWGVPAALLVAALLAATAWYLLLRPAVPPGDLAPALGLRWSTVEAGASAALLTGLLHSGVSGVHVVPYAQLLLAVLAGTVLGIRTIAAPPREVVPSAAPARVAVARVCLVAVATLGLAPLGAALARDVDDVPRQVCVSGELLGGWVAPRFWEQGLRGLPPDPCSVQLVQVG